MVDIHSHVVWGVDDGAPSIEVSLHLLRDAAAAGTTRIAATPHSNGEFFYDKPLIEERIAQLNENMGGKLQVVRGCDLHLSFDNVVEAIGDPKKFSLNGTRYVLVEFSDFTIPSSMDGVLDRFLANDLVPVLTHPERNPILQRDEKRVPKWVDMGCLVQVTALSILGGFGKSAHESAHRLLSKGLVHIVASDAHDPVRRHARLDESRSAVASRYGDAAATLMFETNPGRILDGKIVADGPTGEGQATESKPWWRVW